MSGASATLKIHADRLHLWWRQQALSAVAIAGHLAWLTMAAIRAGAEHGRVAQARQIGDGAAKCIGQCSACVVGQVCENLAQVAEWVGTQLRVARLCDIDHCATPVGFMILSHQKTHCDQ